MPMSIEKLLLENIDYKLETAFKGKTTATVLILKEEFAGVKVAFDTISFEENEVDGDVTCSFNYDILDRANHKDLDENVNFNVCLGNIVNSMLLEYIEATEKAHIDDNTTGKVDIKEFDQ